MSMVHSPTIIPPPRDRVADLQRENDGLKIEIRELRIKLQRIEERESGLEEGAKRLRGALTPLYVALQQVFGDLDAMGIDAPDQSQQETSIPPRVSAMWVEWKTKLGEGPAKVIDALLTHRELNTQQLAMATRYHRTTIPKIIYTLNKAGLINKNGGKFSLKEL